MIEVCHKSILKAAARGWKRSNIGVMGGTVRAFNATPGLCSRPVVELDDCRRRTFLGEFGTQQEADDYAEECRRFLYRCFDRE